jgi:redox-sensing transcriptional repressor
VLGGHAEHPIAIAGIGNLARALINSPMFNGHTSKVVALYDVDPEIVGTDVAGLEVRRLADEDVTRFETPPAIGVLTCPPAGAQDVAEGFCELGIRALMSFSPRVLEVPPEVTVRYVDVTIELQILSYHLEHGRGPLDGGLLRSLGRSPVQAGTRP